MTSPTVRTGIWLFPDAPAAALVDAVVQADRCGVDEVWIADEGVAREPFVIFAAAAQLTARVLMGIGITSPALRHPGAIGSTMATLDELNGGRSILAFGVGGSLSLDPFGLTVDKPVALIRDAIRTSRAVMSRQPADGYDPPTHAAPPRDVPVFVGSKGEQISRLASREADGAFLSGFSLDQLAVPIEWARSVRPIHIALYPSVRFDDDAPDDPTALRGTPTDVAHGMAELIERYQPETIGLALIDGSSPTAHIDKAVEAFRLLRTEAG